MKNIIILFIFFTCLFAKGQSERDFTKATEAYNEGDFNKAIEYYNAILEDGQHSAALYFNLGNSYYKLNEIASSIYYYEKALLLKPNDPEILNNLGYAQNMALDAIDTVPETGLSKIYKMATNRLSFDQWAYVGVFFMFLFVVLYILFYYFQYSSRKRWSFIGSFIALFIAVVALVFAYVQYNDFKKDQPAIVFADEVGIHSEPNTKSEEVFVLHAGTKVNVLDELDDWKKIRIADGKTGWIPRENIKLLKDF